MNELYAILAGIVGLILFALFGKMKETEKEYNMSRVPDNVKRWAEPVEKYAKKYNVPFPVAMAVLWVESAGDPGARGSAGESGLYQLKKIAVTDIEQAGYGNFKFYDIVPEKNIEAGISFLDLQITRTGSIAEGLKAYNQGQRGAKENPVLADQYLRKVTEKIRFFE